MRTDAHLDRPRRTRTPAMRLLVGIAILLLATPLVFGQERAGPPMAFEVDRFDTPAPIRSTAHETLFDDPTAGATSEGFSLAELPDLTSPENLAPAIQLVVLLTVLSLAPAILVLCTSFTRIIIVLSLLRQAIGAQNLPPNQVLIGLSLFMTCVVMGPTWHRINDQAIQPYLDGQITQQEALDRGVVPLREFMIAQIEAAGNDDTAVMFHEWSRQPVPQDREMTWGDIGTMTLIPSFVLSELKVAFLMGFKIYLPFLVIDMVIAAVLISMGMMMLPPVLISLPFKLLLFVLVDGWVLVVGSLMGSFALAASG